jgi:hypothetical protein
MEAAKGYNEVAKKHGKPLNLLEMQSNSLVGDVVKV